MKHRPRWLQPRRAGVHASMRALAVLIQLAAWGDGTPACHIHAAAHFRCPAQHPGEARLGAAWAEGITPRGWPLLHLRGGADEDENLPGRAMLDADMPGELRRGSLLSRSADLVKRSWSAAPDLQNGKARSEAKSAAGRGADDAVPEDVDFSVGTGEHDRAHVTPVSAGPRLKCTVVEPQEKHTATVIWLHGRDHDPDDLIHANLPEALALPWCKFVFVHSPKRCGGARAGGLEAPEGGEGGEGGDENWGGNNDSPGSITNDRGGRWLPTGQSAISEMDSLLRLVNGLHRIIREETSGDKGVRRSQRVVLAGHGEGAVVAMAAALSCRQPLGGLVSLSAWFPRVLLGWCDGQTVAGLRVSYAARRTPGLVCHGLGDPTVSQREGKEVGARLGECGIAVESKEYVSLAHDFSIPELLDVHRFVAKAVPRVERLLSHKRNPHEREGACKRRADWGLTKLRPWNARHLVLRDNVLYAYTTQEDFLERRKAVDEWELDTVSFVASDKKTAGRTIELRDASTSSSAQYFFLYFVSEIERDQWLDTLAASAEWQAEEKERQRRATIVIKDDAPAAKPASWWSVPWTSPRKGEVGGKNGAGGGSGNTDSDSAGEVGARWSCFGWGGGSGDMRYLSTGSSEVDGRVSRGPRSSGSALLLSRVPQPLCGGGGRGPKMLPPQERKRAGEVPQWENLVFSGGGIKVCAFPSALGVVARCFGDAGQDLRWVKRTAGVSGGAVMAVAVACGYTVDELKEIALSFDFGGIADETERATGVLSTPATISRLLSDFGAVSGDILAHKVDDIIRKQTGLSGATFQQLYDHTGILLKIFATSLRTGELLEFSSTRTPSDQVCVAARCSMAVPFLFDAVWTREGDRLVDGAVIDNCPVWCFDTEIKTARGSDSARERGPDAQLGGDPRRFLKQEHASRAKFGGRIVPGAEGAGGGTRGRDEGDEGTEWIRNPKTLALWIETGRNPQQAAPRSLQNFCVRVGDMVLISVSPLSACTLVSSIHPIIRPSIHPSNHPSIHSPSIDPGAAHAATTAEGSLLQRQARRVGTHAGYPNCNISPRPCPAGKAFARACMCVVTVPRAHTYKRSCTRTRTRKRTR